MADPRLPLAVLAAHLEHMRQRGLTPNTILQRRRALERIGRQLPVPLLEATPEHLAAWRAALTVAPGSVRIYGAHLRDFCHWALAEGLISSDPSARLLLPRLVKGLPRPIGEDVLMDAVTTAPPRVRPWLVLAGWAGLRAVEVAFLRRERVLDTATPPVILVASDATKGHKERAIPASEFLLAELRTYGLPRSGWVFRRHDGLPGPNQPATISRLAGKHLRSCGTNATFHQARHRFASTLYRQTHDLRLVQELLGHTDPATTAGYAAYDRSGAAEAVNNLPTPSRLRIMEDASGVS